MLKSWMRDVTLSLQARSGVTPALFVWLAIIAVALLAAFVFLCVAGYVWLSLQLGAVFAGLAMAAVFLLIALIGAVVSAVTRRRAKNAPSSNARHGRKRRRRRCSIQKFSASPCRPAARSAGSASYRSFCSAFWRHNGCARATRANPKTRAKLSCPTFHWCMISSENRLPLFGIMR
jgi:hypothetical protein